jgi:acyl-CoA synthetase (AMP-forming)/AMP-acid ligase II
MASDGTTITYRQLDEEANRLSRLLRGLGLLPGDHVAFCLENHPSFLVVAWGCHYAGLYYTALSTRLTDAEAAYILNDCGAQAFITSATKGRTAGNLVEAAPKVSTWLMLDGTIEGFASYEDAVAEQSPEPMENRLPGADMLYSSGTTGRPKGVKPRLERRPLEEAGSAVFTLMTKLFGFDEDSVYLSTAPLYHAAPLRFCMGVLMSGGTVVVMEKFDAEESLRAIERHRVTHSQWVPTMFIRLLKLDDERRSAYDLSSLTFAVHSAAPCPIEVKRQMMEWWGPIVHEYYGGTEGSGFVYCSPEEWLAHPGSVGRAVLGTLHIVDDAGNEVPIGETGTIYFGGKGAAAFKYHNDPAKTADARDPRGRGWSTLGDVGRVDEDGFLYLTDRQAFMIISGGVNIYPQEAENVLSMHPKVHDVAVFGVPNDDFGEEVKAVVQPSSGYEGSTELERELISYCRERLADVKCPRSIDFRQELPRHATGKLYKRLLKDEYWAGRESNLL